MIKPSIFKYVDYRKYLYDACNAFAASGKGGPVTYESISKGIGIKSPGHFTLILQGKANISSELAEKMITWFRFKKRESEYFRILVKYNQAGSYDEKSRSFNELISFPKSCIYRVDTHQYKYYQKWYHSAIRSLVEIFPVSDNFSELARLVIPAIRPDQASSSIRLLEELGHIEKGADGVYRLTQKGIDTGASVPSVAVNGFVVEMLQRAREALDLFEREERILSWVTFATSPQGYKEILDELRAFRLKAAEIAGKYPAERVYQTNIQVFPLSTSIRGARQ